MSTTALLVIAAASGTSVAQHGGAPAIWMAITMPLVLIWGVVINRLPFTKRGEFWIAIAHVTLGALCILAFPLAIAIS